MLLLQVGYPPFYDQSRTGTEERIVTKMPDFPATVRVREEWAARYRLG